ncbi:MAG TPA: ABC transporter substrate-binding protein [Candidatus Dormibacteraeota bacterium]|jgi:ABC-type branched-subunit amino acid transport system substrate-binding protein
MGSNLVRERVAVAFITLSIAASGLFAVVVAQEYNKPGTGQVVAGGAGADVTASDQPSANAAGGPSNSNGGGGGSTTTTQGGSSGGGGGGGGGTASVATTQAKSGVTGDSITVGGIFDETGPVDSSVERDTVKAYFQKINDAGGINGRRLVMKQCDSQYDSTATHQCSQQMVSANVLAIVGWTAPKGEDDEVHYLAGQQGIPIVGGLGTPEEYNYHLSYPVSIPFTRYGAALADEIAAKGYKHPAIVYISDVGWVAPVLKALEDALKAKGITPTHVEAAVSTDGDYSGHVVQMENNCDYSGNSACPSQKPDSVIGALDPFSYARLFQAMDRAQWHPPVFGGGLDKYTSQKDYGDQLDKAQSVVPFLSPYDNTNNPTVADYLSSVQKYYPSQYQALDIYTQHSWTAAMVFVEAVKRAGTNLTRASLVQALDSIHNFPTGWSSPISYGTGNHDPNHCVRQMQHDPQPFPNGTWHTVSDWKCY